MLYIIFWCVEHDAIDWKLFRQLVIYIVIYCAVSQKFALWHFFEKKNISAVSVLQVHSANIRYHIFFKLFLDFFSNGLERPKGVLFSLWMYIDCFLFVKKSYSPILEKLLWWHSAIFSIKMTKSDTALPPKFLLYKKTIRYFNSFKTFSNVTLKIYRNRINHL